MYTLDILYTRVNTELQTSQIGSVARTEVIKTYHWNKGLYDIFHNVQRRNDLHFSMMFAITFNKAKAKRIFNTSLYISYE